MIRGAAFGLGLVFVLVACFSEPFSWRAAMFGALGLVMMAWGSNR